MSSAHSPKSGSTESSTAVMVTIGDELLSGDTVNSNATFVGERCRGLGIPLKQVLTVRDRIEEIVEAVRTAATSADVCLVSGGLGPTTDDLTAEAIAWAVGVELERDGGALERLEAKFKAFGRPMAPANRKQADFPQGAEILPNPIGSAEGFAVQLGTCRVFVMPGVPREMKKMLTEEIEPRIAKMLDLQTVTRRIYRTLGRGESSLAEAIAPVLESARARHPALEAMFVHYRASMPEVLLILEGTPGADGVGATADELRTLDEPLAEVIGAALYGIGLECLAPRVLAALSAHSLHLATAESCTGGGVGRLLAATPGASSAFDGGVIAYDNRIKTSLLGVAEQTLSEHGAVSEPTAVQMAAGARKAMGSDLGVAVTGIAGPTGGSKEKPVGTVHIAVSDANGVTHKRLQLRGSRGTVQRSAELWALKMVWDRLRARGLASIEEKTS